MKDKIFKLLHYTLLFCILLTPMPAFADSGVYCTGTVGRGEQSGTCGYRSPTSNVAIKVWYKWNTTISKGSVTSITSKFNQQSSSAVDGGLYSTVYTNGSVRVGGTTDGNVSGGISRGVHCSDSSTFYATLPIDNTPPNCGTATVEYVFD